MRSRYVVSRKSPLKVEQPELPKHAPLLPVLEEIAQRKQMKLQEDLEQRTWSWPQCVLTWTTPKDITCTLYLVGGPGDFQVDLHCWRRNHMIERRRWNSRSLNATHAVRQLLESIHDWSLTLD